MLMYYSRFLHQSHMTIDQAQGFHVERIVPNFIIGWQISKQFLKIFKYVENCNNKIHSMYSQNIWYGILIQMASKVILAPRSSCFFNWTCQFVCGLYLVVLSTKYIQVKCWRKFLSHEEMMSCVWLGMVTVSMSVSSVNYEQIQDYYRLLHG